MTLHGLGERLDACTRRRSTVWWAARSNCSTCAWPYRGMPRRTDGLRTWHTDMQPHRRCEAAGQVAPVTGTRRGLAGAQSLCASVGCVGLRPGPSQAAGLRMRSCSERSQAYVCGRHRSILWRAPRTSAGRGLAGTHTCARRLSSACVLPPACGFLCVSLQRPAGSERRVKYCDSGKVWCSLCGEWMQSFIVGRTICAPWRVMRDSW